jgi:hypothetical protein
LANPRQGKTRKRALGAPTSPQQRSDQARKPVISEQDCCSAVLSASDWVRPDIVQVCCFGLAVDRYGFKYHRLVAVPAAKQLTFAA